MLLFKTHPTSLTTAYSAYSNMADTQSKPNSRETSAPSLVNKLAIDKLVLRDEEEQNRGRKIRVEEEEESDTEKAPETQMDGTTAEGINRFQGYRSRNQIDELQRPHSSHGYQRIDAPTSNPQQLPFSASISHLRPRARSPYSWSGYRSRSSHITSASIPLSSTPIPTLNQCSPPKKQQQPLAAAPAFTSRIQLARTRSSPAVIPQSQLAHQRANTPLSPTNRPSSPFRPPVRVRSPLRNSQTEDSFGTEFASISEDRELEFAPRSVPMEQNSGSTTINYSLPRSSRSSSSSSSLSSSPYLGTSPTALSMFTSGSGNNNPSMLRRRTNSPMRHVSPPTSAHSSPLLAPARYNESYPFPATAPLPGTATTTTTAAATSTISTSPNASNASSSFLYPSYYAPSSSVPSTPTSTRSRSPSISSLETIPDSPGAEEAAVQEDKHLARLRAEAEAEAAAARGEGRGRSADAGEGVGNGSGAGGGVAVPRALGGIAVRDKRKRWSVCGAESRRDLDLETIWED